MSYLISRISRRTIVQVLIALPLFRNRPAVADPDEIAPEKIDRDEIIEVNGWILRRSDLA
ncbi:hypothetical protein RFN28_17815 [Mesorhizobium sp. VK24D]|uniref:Uncharacterized protein n=1 Tax=Mesorhizobium album TaxID=3072314 RepID=A0ABU4Y0U3_9HYPH|nr:hypothetical protein [Mesorhizobium sp. VK24D]MDX8480306.1 hypothetical protein [Mesorhizobium sp. VK24D]